MSTPLDALRHVCDVLDIGEDGFNHFVANRIWSVRRLMTITNEICDQIMKQENAVLCDADFDKINIFCCWFDGYQARKGGVFKSPDIIADFTTDEWEAHANEFIH